MFKVRFHLKNGPHKMHWQITSTVDKSFIQYVNPEEYDLVLDNAQLYNRPSTARWIKQNDLKQVCAWVLCKSFTLWPRELLGPPDMIQARFNPMDCDHWHPSFDQSINLDGLKADKILTKGRKVFFRKCDLSVDNKVKI